MLAASYCSLRTFSKLNKNCSLKQVYCITALNPGHVKTRLERCTCTVALNSVQC